MAPAAAAAHDSARQRMLALVENPRAERLIIALIIINAITLGVETSPEIMASHGEVIHWLDRVILLVFVVELAIRIVGHGLRFFRDAWNVFDFLVIAVALAPAGAEYAVLRALRVLRVLRLLSIVPQMRRVVSALLAAIPGLSSIMLVLGLIFYVFAVMATNLFAAAFPDWFGDLGRTMFTLFQIMTLEGWSGDIARPVMEKFPYAWIFFVIFIMIATFTMLNLFIAIIVSAMQTQAHDEGNRAVAAVQVSTQTVDQYVHAELQQVRAELITLRESLERAGLTQTARSGGRRGGDPDA
jgi:voltage-gated sodium channel